MMKKGDGFILLALAVVAVLAHWMIVPIGFNLLNADFATEPMVSSQFRSGYWSAFHFGQFYGGTTLTALRALWSAFWETFDHRFDAHVTSQMTFGYLVLPVLMSSVSYFLVRSYFSRVTAAVVGFMAAIGFQFWITQYNNDFYLAYLLLGSILLALRGRYQNPFLEMGPRRFFVLCVLAGLSFYTARISAIYILAVFVPWQYLGQEIRRYFKPQDRVERVLLYLSLSLLCLFIYFQAFGPFLGVFWGHPIKTQWSDVFRAAFFVVAIYSFKVHARLLGNPAHRRQLFIGIMGFVIGMLPEILHWLRLGTLPPNGMGNVYSFTETLTALGTVPQSLRELVSSGQGFGQNASLLLLLLSIFAFFRELKRNRFLVPIAATGALALFAYCYVRTYVFAPARYLLPIFPALIVTYGAFIERLLRSPKKWIIVFGGLLIVLHLGHQWSGRREMVAKESQRTYLADSWKVVETFKGQKLDLVMSNNYWHSNQYTVLSQANPMFLTEDRMDLRPEGFSQLIKTVKRVGILIDREGPQPSDRRIAFFKQNWRLSPLGKVGELSLYVGEKD